MLEQLVTAIPENARKLIAAFWPGPLTLLLPRSAAVPDSVTAGRPLVGIRMPSHPVAFELIRRAGVPIAAPSANTFSRTSPTTAAHVLEDLDGRIDAILDAGPTHHGVESTVLDPNPSPMVIYRPGAITADQIREVAGAVEIHTAERASGPPQALPSPGVGLRHYAPRARLVLVEGPLAELPSELAATAALYPNERVGIMLPADLDSPAIAGATFSPGAAGPLRKRWRATSTPACAPWTLKAVRWSCARFRRRRHRRRDPRPAPQSRAQSLIAGSVGVSGPSVWVCSTGQRPKTSPTGRPLPACTCT